MHEPMSPSEPREGRVKAKRGRKESAGTNSGEGREGAPEDGGGDGGGAREKVGRRRSASLREQGSVWLGVVAALCAVSFLFLIGSFTYSLTKPGVYFSNGTGSGTESGSGGWDEGTPASVHNVTGRADLAALVHSYPMGVALAVVAKWCSHCKRLAPEWNTAAAQLRHDGAIALARLEATASDEAESLAEDLGVQGFPSIRLFRGNPDESEEYQGPVDTADHIAIELRGLFSPAVTRLSSVIPAGVEESALEAAKRVSVEAGGKPVVLALLDPGSRASGYREELEIVARRLRKYGRCAAFLLGDVEHGDAVAVVRGDTAGIADSLSQDEKDLFRFGISSGSQLLADFLDDRLFPSVVLLTPKGPSWATELFVSNDRPRLVAIVDDLEVADGVDASDTAALLRDAVAAASSVTSRAGRYRAFLVPAKGFESASKFLGYVPGGGDLPFVVIHEGNLAHGQGRRFAYVDTSADPPTAAALAAWLNSHASGSLGVSLRSEPVPPASDFNLPVRKAVGSTLRALTDTRGDDARAVVVLVHEPGCPYCEAVAPLYAKLGRALEGEPRVTLFAIDAVANDLPESLEEHVDGFPTLVMYPAGGKPPDVFLWNPEKMRCMLDWVVQTCGVSGDPLLLRMADADMPPCTEEDKIVDEIDEDFDYEDFDYLAGEEASADAKRPPWEEL